MSSGDGVAGTEVKRRIAGRGFGTMLGRGLCDGRLCRFVRGFHCRGRRCSIWMSWMSLTAISSEGVSDLGGREEEHGLLCHWGLVPRVTRSQSSICTGQQGARVSLNGDGSIYVVLTSLFIQC